MNFNRNVIKYKYNVFIMHKLLIKKDENKKGLR